MALHVGHLCCYASIRVVPTLRKGHYKLLMVVHLKTQGHGTRCYNEISTRPPPPGLPKNAPRIPV